MTSWLQAHVHQVGVDTPQAADFVSASPDGFGRWSFLHFRSRADVLTDEGRMVAEQGACILLDPRFPHWHRGHRGPLRTDWLVIDGDLDPVVAELELPTNRLERPSTAAECSMTMGRMVGEQLRRQHRWRERLDLLLADLLLLYARGLREEAVAGRRPLAEQLGQLRQHVHSHLAHDWTVDEMARRCGLSRNHFAAQYRRSFDVSPMEDLIRARIRQAAVLLTRGGHGVGECARQVGFRDVPWFSRCFRARMGCSPRAFARDPRRLDAVDTIDG